MASSKTRDIEQIDDLMEMLELMWALDTSWEGLKTLDEMKARVRDELAQSQINPSWAAGQPFSILSEAKERDLRKRQALLNFYTEAEKFFMDDKILALLEQSVGNVKEKMNNRKVQLKEGQWMNHNLIVAGEKGSGKSSIVNLILGEELLPYSALSTTSTICELKYGEKGTVVAHFKDKDPDTGLPTKTIRLQESPTGSSEQGYLQQIYTYALDPTVGKFELFWPHSLLQSGVVVIDCPGIGKSAIEERTIQYLNEAFAFIYVIDGANAEGIQENRLEKLVKEVRNVSLEGQGEFPLECALFVCNKWDQVPEKKSEDVKNHVVRKLQKFWRGLDAESQIIYMSTIKASKAQSHGLITEDVSSLMNGVRSMVLKSVETRLESHGKWLDYLLSRIIFQAKAFVKNASRDREEVVQKISRILLRLLTIEQQQNKVMADLNKYLETREDNAMLKLFEYLSSEEVKARFALWTLDEVPKVESSWEVTKSKIEDVLSTRLQEIIEQWEEDKQVFRTAHESLVQHFQQHYNFVTGQLQNIQVAVTADHVDVPQVDPFDSGLIVGEKVVIGVTSPIWLPLGLVAMVLGAPIAGVLAVKERLKDRKQLKKYEADKCAFMIKESEKYLDAASDEKYLRPFVRDQLQDARFYLKQIEACLVQLFRVPKMLCEQLIDETRSKKELQDLYHPIIEESSQLRGQLAVFRIRELRTNDISSEELEWKDDISSLLGSGAFDTVYKGTLRTHGVVQAVALRVCNKVLDVKNAIKIVAEVDLLRKLEHPHIVKFYGTTLLKKSETVRMILVVEKCKGNLKSHIFEHPESVPANSGNPAVVREVCRWVKQIISALDCIHKQGVVHLDLTLENILLSQDNLVKITNVGISKPVIDITSTLAATPVYIAPEVFHSEVYDCKADIYSLGIIMWEIWYGQQAFNNFPVKSFQRLFALVDGGIRPEHVDGCKKPHARWKRLMSNCWNRNPDERPTAKECYDEIITLLTTPIRVPLTILPEQKAEARVDEESKPARIYSTERKKRNEVNLPQIRRTLDDKVRLHNTKEQQQDNEKIVEQLLGTLDEEQQMRTRAVEELSQARTAYKELVERLERTVDELQRTVEEEQKARIAVNEQLNQARSVCTELGETLETERLSNQSRQEDLQNVIVEQRRHLEEAHQQKTTLEEQKTTLEEQKTTLEEQKTTLEEQKTTLEERLNRLELQFEEEIRRHVSAERELQSAVTVAEQALADQYQRHQSCDWIIQREEIVLSEKILGTGAWGNVREGCFRGCKVAVKEIHELILSDHNRRLFEREMNIASHCRHPNLLQFIGATNDDGSPLFVTELLDSSLRRLFSQRALKNDEIVGLALDIAKGLNYLHLNKPSPIIHRDISSANVLLWRRDESWRAKLSDYGSANFMRQCMTAGPGAFIYAAPEASTSRQTPKLDVYSFGVLLCEMCIRELPNPQEFHSQIGRVNGVMRELIERCVKSDPKQRPTMSEVISELEQPT